MSSPGYFMDDADYANQRRQAMLAQALMGQQPATGNYGGMANGGNQIAGAIALKDMQNRANQTAQNNVMQPPAPGINNAMLSAQTPKLPMPPSMLGKLFGMGGQ